jgi:hypothetical protein
MATEKLGMKRSLADPMNKVFRHFGHIMDVGYIGALRCGATRERYVFAADP